MNIGILGGGQLARMLAQAGQTMGLNFMFLSPDIPSCAAPFGELLQARYDDWDALERLTQWSDVVTYEFENVPAESIKFLEARARVYPSSNALTVSKDRIREKTEFQRLGINTAAFAAIDSAASLRAAVTTIGFPAILKTRTEGYDGKGQVVLKSTEEIDSAWVKLGAVPCILEEMVMFDREVSIIAVRSETGAKLFYPLSENYHRDGILRLTLSRSNDAMQEAAEALITRLLEHLNYVGVLTLELFQVGERLLANEIAPRVHNSGHWTIEGAVTSQFENHLRAICGQTLGATGVTVDSSMVNIIGAMPRHLNTVLPSAKLHDYQKAERVGRKLGHITLLAEDWAVLSERTAVCLALVDESELATRLRNKKIPSGNRHSTATSSTSTSFK